ncbi:MAG: PPC domain-containing protein [Bacteroidota bacterium]
MKNLNNQKATMPNFVKSVSSKFLYSLCAALFLLTCSLSTKAQTGTSSSDLYVMPYTLGFGSGQYTSCQNAVHTSVSPFVNNYGNPYTSGNDKWIQINVASNGTLEISGGTSNYDSVIYLFDSSWNLLASSDDGYGSGWPIKLQGDIIRNVYAGTYYLIVDGSTKSGSSWPASGSVNIQYSLF